MSPKSSILLACCLAFVGCSALVGCSGSGHAPPDGRRFSGQTLHVFNWSDYLDPEIIAEFERRTGTRVQYDTYSSDAELEAKLLTGHAGYDVIFPSDRSLPLLIKKGFIRPLDLDRLSRRKHLDPRYLATPADPRGEYAVPYFTGSVAVGINTERVTEDVRGFEALFDERYRGRITMLDDPENVVAITLLHLGLPMNSTDPEHLAAAERVLVRQRNLVQAYTTDDFKERLIRGDAWVALGWSGDLLQARAENPAIRLVLPETGTMLWVDSMCVPASSRNVELAHAFIDFLHEPEIAAQNAQFVRYATPNLAARALLPDELQNDATVYLTESYAGRCQWLRDKGPEIEKIERLWQTVRNP